MCLPACGHNVYTIIMDGTRLVDQMLSSGSLVNLPSSVELGRGTQSDIYDERSDLPQLKSLYTELSSHPAMFIITHFIKM